MNLAYRDIKHNLLRFVLTNFGLSLLLGIVIVITGVYGGLIDDALRQARAANADLWVVQAGTNGPFAEASRIPGDTRELVSRVYGVERAGSVTYQSVQTELNGKPLRMFLIGFEPGRPGGPRNLLAGRDIYAQPLRNDRRPLRRPRARPGSAARHARAHVHGRRPDAQRTHGFGRSRGLHHLAGRASAAVRARTAGRAPRGRTRGALQTTDQINAVIAKVSPYVPINGGRRRSLALETSHDAHPGPAGNLVEQVRHREGAQPATSDHGAADNRIGGHHCLDCLYADHGQGALDRHAQIRRRAGPDHHRPHRPAGAVDGNIWLLYRTGARPHLSSLTFRGGSCSIPRASPPCSLSRWWSALSPAPSVFGSPSRWTRRKHSRRRVKTMAETNRQAVVRVEGLSKHFGSGQRAG